MIVLPDEVETEDHEAPADAEGGVEIITLNSIWNSIRCLSPASLIITPNPLTPFVQSLRLFALGRFSNKYTHVITTYCRFSIQQFLIPSSIVSLLLIHVTTASHFQVLLEDPATPDQSEPMTLRVPFSNPIMNRVESGRIVLKGAQDFI